MEPSLVVIGLNFRTAPVAVRERFWIGEGRRYDALHHLIRSDGIEEAMVLATCNRTEFIVWASDASEAANSILRFLTREFELKLCEWSNFYRLIDEAALLHVFRVASSLDSMILGETEIVSHFKQAWQTAQNAGTSGRFLDAVMQKSLSVSRRVRTETSIGVSTTSVSSASVELSKKILGSIAGHNVVLVGAGKMSELVAKRLVEESGNNLKVVNRTFEHATELAEKLGGTPISFDNRFDHITQADIVVSSTACPHYIFTRRDAESIMRERESRPLVIIDLAVPRDVDPQVRNVPGCFLFDLDDLERAIPPNTSSQNAAAEEAGKIVQGEAHDFGRKLAAEHAAPTIVALRTRLDEICRQELQLMSEEYGPFTEDQTRTLTTLATHITQRVVGSLARELHELPEHSANEEFTKAVQRLFNLEMRRAIEPANKN